jgi:hypothetical protein
VKLIFTPISVYTIAVIFSIEHSQQNSANFFMNLADKNQTLTSYVISNCTNDELSLFAFFLHKELRYPFE